MFFFFEFLGLLFVASPLIVTVVWAVLRWRAMPTPSSALDEPSRKLLEDARLRLVAAVVVTLISAVGLSIVARQIGNAWIAAVPTLAVALGLLVYVLWPVSRAEAGARRAASLEYRSPGAALHTGALAWWITTAALAIAVGIAICAAPVGARAIGLPHRLEQRPGGAPTSYQLVDWYPGWCLGLPLIAAALVLAVVTWLAIRRVNALPALPGVGIGDADRRWRSESSGMIAQLSASGMLIQFALIVFVWGSSGIMGPRRMGGGLGAMWMYMIFMPTFVVAVVLPLVGAAVFRVITLPRYAASGSLQGTEQVMAREGAPETAP